jgi:hypothetical protein
MSDPGHDPAAAETPAEAGHDPAAVAPAPPGYRGLIPVLAGAAIALAALVATAPFWAASLPWGPGAGNGEAALAARLDRLAAAQRRQAATSDAALHRLDRRIAALAARPVAPPAGLAEVNSRLDKLAGAVADFAQRSAAGNRAAAAQTAAIADLSQRLAALDKEVRSRAATGASDTMLALTLVEIRDAVAAGRPFVAEFARLTALARGRPEIATAAAPLAGSAKMGVASRAALAKELRALAAKIATPPPRQPAAGGWAGATLRRLGGLVTIRRLGAPPPAGPEGALAAAQRALAGGDLEGAVADVTRLEGAIAEAARPWLQAAQERLAVEAALRRLARLAAAPAGLPSTAGSPG